MNYILASALSYILVYKYFAIFTFLFVGSFLLPLPDNAILLVTGALSSQTSNPIIKVVETLSKIDTSSPEAKLNKNSMKDNKGGRIKFNDELTRSQTLKGVEDPTRLPNKKP